MYNDVVYLNIWHIIIIVYKTMYKVYNVCTVNVQI